MCTQSISSDKYSLAYTTHRQATEGLCYLDCVLIQNMPTFNLDQSPSPIHINQSVFV